MSSIFFKAGQSVPHCKHNHTSLTPRHSSFRLELAIKGNLKNVSHTVVCTQERGVRFRLKSAVIGVILTSGTNEQPHLEESTAPAQFWPSHLKRKGSTFRKIHRLMYVKKTITNSVTAENWQLLFPVVWTHTPTVPTAWHHTDISMYEAAVRGRQPACTRRYILQYTFTITLFVISLHYICSSINMFIW